MFEPPVPVKNAVDFAAFGQNGAKLACRLAAAVCRIRQAYRVPDQIAVFLCVHDGKCNVL